MGGEDMRLPITVASTWISGMVGILILTVEIGWLATLGIVMCSYSCIIFLNVD